MSEDKWNVFAATGKISDYLSYKETLIGNGEMAAASNTASHILNGDVNADANRNADI